MSSAAALAVRWRLVWVGWWMCFICIYISGNRAGQESGGPRRTTKQRSVDNTMIWNCKVRCRARGAERTLGANANLERRTCCAQSQEGALLIQLLNIPFSACQNLTKPIGAHDNDRADPPATYPT